MSNTGDSNSDYVNTQNYLGKNVIWGDISRQIDSMPMSQQKTVPLELLQIKETQMESLEEEIQRFRGLLNQGINYNQTAYKLRHDNARSDSMIEIPKNLEQLFRRMSITLQEREDELADVRTRLESVLTALALDPSNSITKYGRYDAETIAHKTVVRIETLARENTEMAKMLAYGRAKETQIEIELLKRENYELRQQLELLRLQVKSK